MNNKLLDLFCKAGGAAMGYFRAGFEVYGIDIETQKNYPFPFLQMDAIEALTLLLNGESLTFSNGETLYLSDFSIIHASPPCQRYAKITGLVGRQEDHPDLLQPTIDLLEKTDKYYVVENVVGAPMKNYLMLCGTMFGLRVFRHRLFVCKPAIMFSPMSCNHHSRSSNGGHNGDQKHPDGKFITVTGHFPDFEKAKKAMGIEWMTRSELSQSIPPAYTEFIGRNMIESLQNDNH